MAGRMSSFQQAVEQKKILALQFQPSRLIINVLVGGLIFGHNSRPLLNQDANRTVARCSSLLCYPQAIYINLVLLELLLLELEEQFIGKAGCR